MKFSYSWLCDHLETDKNATEIGDALTNLGLELESLTDYSSYSKFVVATIKDFHKHPNADRLNICTVDDGTKTYQVICGANNVKKGLKGIFAKDGMYIPGTQIYLKKGKIRGEISEGMLLSERELNLSDDHDGIIELSDNFHNGTSAIDIAVQSLEIGVGDEVILPAFTIISTILQVVRSGAKPVLIDSDPLTWNMNVDQIEAKITTNTKAIMAVHIYGLPVEMKNLIDLCKKYNLKLIEDAAEVIGQTYRNISCGSFGDISTVSFYPNKHITTGP